MAEENQETATITFDLDKPLEFNRLMLQEPIRGLGQRIESFNFEVKRDGKWTEIGAGTTIGYKNILRFPSVSSNQVRINITGSRVCPALSFAGLYQAPEILADPFIKRDKAGSIQISSDSPDTIFHYTLDGSDPAPESPLYSGPFPLPEGGILKVRGFVDNYGQFGDIVTRRYYISAEKWTASNSETAKSRFPAGNAIDGDPDTFWMASWDEGAAESPSITIDLGETISLRGFTYLPRSRPGDAGTVLSYNCQVSRDGKKWTAVIKNGIFDNIRNNPVLQEVRFSRAQTARFLRFIPLEEIGGRKIVTAAEIEVIT